RFRSRRLLHHRSADADRSLDGRPAARTGAGERQAENRRAQFLPEKPEVLVPAAFDGFHSPGNAGLKALRRAARRTWRYARSNRSAHGDSAMQTTRIQLLQRMALFGALRQETLQFLLEQSRSKSVPAGEYF